MIEQVDKLKDKKKGSVQETGQPETTRPAGMVSADPLLECLVFLTAHYGRGRSGSAITAGLAYDENGMGPELFCSAAGRMGLKSKIVKRSLADIPEPVLPAVLVLNDRQACVLLSVDQNTNNATVFSPSSGKEEVLSLRDLTKTYTGYAIFVQPQTAFTDPEAPQIAEASRHWFWGAVLENKGLYGRVVLGAILINLFALTSPIFIMGVYDRVIPNNAMETGWVLGLGALTVFVFDFIIRTLRSYFIDVAGRRIDVVVSKRIYDHLLDMKLAGKPVSGGAFANMLREFDSVRDFLTSATMTAVVDLPFTFFFLFIIYLIGGPIAFLIGSLLLVVIGVGMLLQWPLRVLVGKSIHASEAKHGLLVETITGLETIKAIRADSRMRARYGAYIGESAAQAQSARFVSGVGVNFASFLQQSATVMVVLIGMYLVRDAELSMGGLIAVVILAGRAIAPIGQVANLMARYHQTRSAMKTLNNIMTLPSERPPEKRFLHRPNLSGKITFRNVGFTYPQTENRVLNDISFTINAGEKVGVIGRIGSGKSTIARLMVGLYDPDGGEIYADDTDYRQIDPADLRRNIAYIAQDVVLFRASIRENIAISCPQATEEEILEAAKAAGVHDFVSRHPMGYDAPVGERGEGLSGGQRQAIALARAMLLKPAVMVCDEPTNAMDMEAERAFTKHIKDQVGNKTLILITHRQNLLTLVDRLILLDQGKVILDGPRDEVIAALSSGQVKVRDPHKEVAETP